MEARVSESMGGEQREGEGGKVQNPWVEEFQGKERGRERRFRIHGWRSFKREAESWEEVWWVVSITT